MAKPPHSATQLGATQLGATGAAGDSVLWRRAMHGVRPLRDRPAAAPETPPPAAAPDREPRAAPPPPDRFAGIDRANAERLKRGRHPIEARLDLHGMTQIEAHRELAAFIRLCADAERRCVLVITGRGLGPNGPGVLKSAVPRWLAETPLRHRILAIAPAQPRHGGAGALYLLLRRRR
ncbi:MAG: Smr/MutS family protein [Stellaceae bacterium]